MQENPQPLSGIKIVENARDVAAQYCGRLLAAMGATVIKVEPPGGLPMRRHIPLLSQSPPRGALFEYLNIGKDSVTCDLAQPAGLETFAGLLNAADTLLDDTALENRGSVLESTAVRRKFSDLIYVSVLPFGAKGDFSQYKAHELNLLHAGGEGFLMPNGLALERFPDRAPVKIHGHFAEFVGGMSAVTATLAAFFAREKSGGQFVDVSVQDANLSIGCFAIQRLGDGVLETRHTRSFKYGGVLECRDGYVQLLVLEQHQWESLVGLMGGPEWATIAEYADPLERGRRGAQINQKLREWFSTQTVMDVVREGQAANVPIAPYNDVPAIFDSDAVTKRQNFQETELQGLGKMRAFVAPYKFPESPLRIGRGIGEAGCDNAKYFGRSAVPSGTGAVA